MRRAVVGGMDIVTCLQAVKAMHAKSQRSKRVFGEAVPMISSTKGLIGHSILTISDGAI